ncbi:MAG: lysine biosynthesis protein LysW [Deltaproteobacteria bacterium]|nr:lysine biosynthesis protein LysW [Deltaproteobacteria bacterium]
MALNKKNDLYMNCPMCDCELPMGGDEKVGEEISCPYCETPLKLRKSKKDEDKLILEEDF